MDNEVWCTKMLPNGYNNALLSGKCLCDVFIISALLALMLTFSFSTLSIMCECVLLSEILCYWSYKRFTKPLLSAVCIIHCIKLNSAVYTGSTYSHYTSLKFTITLRKLWAGCNFVGFHWGEKRGKLYCSLVLSV